MLYEYLPTGFISAAEHVVIPWYAKVLYGGITEELLIRWGFMSFIVWANRRLSLLEIWFRVRYRCAHDGSCNNDFSCKLYLQRILMTQLLSVSNTLLSMRGRMPITDERGKLIWQKTKLSQQRYR